MRLALALFLAALLAAACQPGGVARPSVSAATGTPSGAAGAPSLAATPTAGLTPTPVPEAARCGQRIDRSFVLANDLTCEGDALVVAADGITIDLGGRLLKGPGMGAQTWPSPQLESVGIRAEGRSGITVRNGRIAEFSTGVYFVRVTASIVEAVTSSRSRFGVYVHDSDGNTIRGSTVESNVYGLHLQNANDTLIQDNRLVRQTYNSPGGYGLYLYSSRRNRIVDNTIENNVNWGIWFSEARGNFIFHNNVLGNRPQVSDSNEENQWYDPEKKEGNFWGDYGGRDGDSDGIGDQPYAILGAGRVVDAYPFVERDGWKGKTVGTIDHYRPPPAPARRDVRVLALAGGSVVSAAVREQGGATPIAAPATAMALSTDGATVYALDGRSLTRVDLLSGAAGEEVEIGLDATLVAANRDGRSVFLIGPTAAEQIDLASGARVRFTYDGAPTAIAASYKHNQMFVATRDGIDMMYIRTSLTGSQYSRGGHVPYTIPLGGQPAAMAMNAAGTRIYAAVPGTRAIEVVDTEQLMVVDRIAVGADVRSLAADVGGSRLFAVTTDGIFAVDLPARAVGGLVPLPGRAVDVAVSPNGDEVYVGLSGDRLGIATLSAGDLAVMGIIDLSDAPTRLLVATY